MFLSDGHNDPKVVPGIFLFIFCRYVEHALIKVRKNENDIPGLSSSFRSVLISKLVLLKHILVPGIYFLFIFPSSTRTTVGIQAVTEEFLRQSSTINCEITSRLMNVTQGNIYIIRNTNFHKFGIVSKYLVYIYGK